MPACVAAIRGSVYSVAVSGGGHGAPLPRPQGPPGGVAGQEIAQGGGARAGKAEPEQRSHDLLLVDLGMSAYHRSTSSRFTKSPTIWSIMALSPNSLSDGSVQSDPPALRGLPAMCRPRSCPNRPAPLRLRPVDRRPSRSPPGPPARACAGTQAETTGSPHSIPGSTKARKALLMTLSRPWKDPQPVVDGDQTGDDRGLLPPPRPAGVHWNPREPCYDVSCRSSAAVPSA